MPSTLAWLDHDSAAQDRAKRILALFQEKGTQDQLGLGGIRDSFSDLLFPGISTIQTRLRYYLFVPWIYQELEAREIPSARIAAVARERELALVEPLLSTEEEGVFGKAAGGKLKRLPSEVYWGGLVSWGIRRFDASINQYHRALDEIYRRRKEARRVRTEGTEASAGVVTWHPELPPPPVSFPQQATLSLTREEADFIRDRIVAEHPSSLLAWLGLHPVHTDVRFPWEHPLAHAMPPEHRKVLYHARMFSEVMHGAPMVYNLMVSEEAGRDDLVEEYRDRFREWADSLDLGELEQWPMGVTLAIARGQGGHTISAQTETFVRRWVDLVRQNPHAVSGLEETRRLIRHREMFLKGPRSLFTNRKALEEKYSGGLGMGRLNFRWPEVQQLLRDLYDGLEGG